MSEIRSGSAWDAATIAAFLDTTVIPIRLGCSDTQGVPLICSLWYVYDDGALWCATQQSASVVKLLEREPRCAFEVAPESMPYRGVRGQGTAELRAADGEAMLLRLLDRYVGTRESDFAKWLIKRAANEVAIRITPTWLNAWDFSARMEPTQRA